MALSNLVHTKHFKIIVTASILSLAIIAGILYFLIMFIYSSNSTVGKIIPGKIMKLSLSTDGNFVVSTDLKRQVILWDLTHKTWQPIASDANIFSAYFIRRSHNFIWQNNHDNQVYVADVKGHIIKHFNPGFKSYGQVMSTDLTTYFASDKHWNLYYCQLRKCQRIARDNISHDANDDDQLPDYGKLLNLTMAFDDSILLSSGVGWSNEPRQYNFATMSKTEIDHAVLDGVVLWDTDTGRPITNFPGNAAKTYATLSPILRYVVSGDENGNVLVADVASRKILYKLWDLYYGKAIKKDRLGDNIAFDKTGLIKPPKDFNLYERQIETLAIHFIDYQGHYLQFIDHEPYVVLYRIGDPKPIKYIFLGHHPLPSVDDYLRDQAIDTVANAKLLVMAKADAGGIIVYRFIPSTLQLKKIWVS